MTSLKKLLSLLLITSQLFALVTSAEVAGTYLFSVDFSSTFSTGSAVRDTGSVSWNDGITSYDIINAMGFGWNLGNSLDAYGSDQNQGTSSETYWGNPQTTEALIKAVYNAGFKLIRIPVTWHNHLQDNNYTIDPTWTRRVKTVVDWAIKYGLYVILNVHHDNAESSGVSYGKGYYPSTRDRKVSENFIYNMWKQIALAFNNGYDHHLIFEVLNEPRPIGTTYEWWYSKGDDTCEQAASALNEYLRVGLKAIRESGGNNAKRFVMVPPLSASPSTALSCDFIFPGDRKYNPTNEKIILSVHAYQPYDFAMNADWSIKYFTSSYQNELYSLFSNLYNNFVAKGHHVIIGEMGAVDKLNDGERIKWGQYFISTARQFQMGAVLWDNNIFDNSNSPNEVFGYLQRNSLAFKNTNLISSWVSSSKTALSAKISSSSSSSSTTTTTTSSGSSGSTTVVSSPVTFQNWNTKVTITSDIFSKYNSDCKISFTTTDPSYYPEYRAMVVNLGDWSAKLSLSSSQVSGAGYSDGGLSIYSGTNNVVISLSSDNLSAAKSKGLILDGHGFVVKTLSVSGKSGSSYTVTVSNGSSSTNLLDAKINFDDSNLKTGVYFAPELLSKATSSSKLVLETQDLYSYASTRYLSMYQGTSSTLLNKVNVSSGTQTITVSLSNYYSSIKSSGLTLRGLGFSLKAVYLQ